MRENKENYTSNLKGSMEWEQGWGQEGPRGPVGRGSKDISGFKEQREQTHEPRTEGRDGKLETGNFHLFSAADAAEAALQMAKTK